MTLGEKKNLQHFSCSIRIRITTISEFELLSTCGAGLQEKLRQWTTETGMVTDMRRSGGDSRS